MLCPASVVDNWAEEVARWAPKTAKAVYSYLGPVFKVRSATEKGLRLSVVRQWASGVGVLILGYEMFRFICQGQDEVGSLLRRGATIVVADEVHKLKSENTPRILAFTLHTTCRLGLTGTPLTNDVGDVYRILTWASRKHPFGSAETFRDRYDGPIRKGSYADSSAAQKEVASLQVMRFQELLNPFAYRRTVAALNEANSLLPPKIEFYLMLRLGSQQMHLHSGYLKMPPGREGGDYESQNTMI